jgi:hypothetical protein
LKINVKKMIAEEMNLLISLRNTSFVCPPPDRYPWEPETTMSKADKTP